MPANNVRQVNNDRSIARTAMLLSLFHDLFLQLFWKLGDYGFVSQIDQIRQFLRRKTFQIDGVPVGLLHRWAVVAPNHDARPVLSEQFALKSGTFQGDFIFV